MTDTTKTFETEHPEIQKAPQPRIVQTPGTYAQRDDEIEIDLMELFFAIKKHFLKLVLVAILGGGLTFAYNKFLITSQYQSTAAIFILSKETTLTSLADLQIGSQLTKDYKVVVTSRPVLQDVIDKLDLDMDYTSLKNKLSIVNPADTRILQITATDPSPERAKEIADAIANTSSEYIADIMEMIPPKMIESGVVATQKSSPHVLKNTILGAFLAGCVAGAYVVIMTLMDDTIKSEDDVEKYLGLSVLASVPEREAASPSATQPTRGRKRRR